MSMIVAFCEEQVEEAKVKINAGKTEYSYSIKWLEDNTDYIINK